MSDMTSLSHQYTTNATFAEQINAWVLAIKKASLGVAQAALPASKELDEARARLSELLVDAIARLNAGAEGQGLTEEEGADLVCPEEVLERIQETKLLDVLDEFSDAADGLASESFRRLWRR
jgi:hypothetical protein